METRIRMTRRGPVSCALRAYSRASLHRMREKCLVLFEENKAMAPTVSKLGGSRAAVLSASVVAVWIKLNSTRGRRREGGADIGVGVQGRSGPGGRGVNRLPFGRDPRYLLHSGVSTTWSTNFLSYEGGAEGGERAKRGMREPSLILPVPLSLPTPPIPSLSYNGLLLSPPLDEKTKGLGRS